MTTRQHFITALLVGVTLVVCAMLSSSVTASAGADGPSAPMTWSHYDEGDFYLNRDGKTQSYHGMRQAWVYNRAMVWLDKEAGVDDAIICYSSQSPLPLTGKKQVSRWYVNTTPCAKYRHPTFEGDGSNETVEVDDNFTCFVKNDSLEWGHIALPPFQFQIEQHPRAQLEVKEATHPWQFFIVVKGRGGLPFYISPWQKGPGKLTVDILKLYRQKGYDHHFAEMNFFVATWTKNPAEQAKVVFRLDLDGDEMIVPSLPVIRTAKRAKDQGVPICAVVLDRQAKRLGKGAVEVTASLGKKSVKLSDIGDGIWKAVVPGLTVGEHKATLRVVWKGNGKKAAASTLDIRITDGQFIGYDPKLKLLTKNGKPLGPITGSYRAQLVFKDFGTPEESLLHGLEEWQTAISKDHPSSKRGIHTPSKGVAEWEAAVARDPSGYGFHWWESLTESELDKDYAYLKRCGWSMIHLCQGWLWWPRLDAVGRISPYYAEKFAKVFAVAGRHGLHVHLAVSHYPMGWRSLPYAQYLEAGYPDSQHIGWKKQGHRDAYDNPDSSFSRLFADYLAQFATVFRDESTLSSFTAAGEGDGICGKTFVNMVHDTLMKHDGNHLFFCEPFGSIDKNPNYYRKDGWKPLLGGMRIYYIPMESITVTFKLSAMGHIFMGEGLFYGLLGGKWEYMNAGMPIDSYRNRIRHTYYTGLVHRNPILLGWEQRIVEDEQIVFEQVRRAVDWSKPFETPRLAIRVGPNVVKDRAMLHQYDKALLKIPLEYTYIWQDEPVGPGILFTIDARKPFVQPTFVSEGGTLPDALKATMPLGLPEGLVANYSWSQDHRTLLAFVQGTSPQQKASGIVLQNFPSDELEFQLFDLAAKKSVSQGRFSKTVTIKVPGQAHHFFLLVNDRKDGR